MTINRLSIVRLESYRRSGTPYLDQYATLGDVLGVPALVTTIAGTTYTLVAADGGSILKFTSGSAVTLTVPTGLSVGFTCGILQTGAGAVTISASGTTVHNRSGYTTTAGQYAFMSLVSYDTDVFVSTGDGV